MAEVAYNSIPWTQSNHLFARGTGDILRTARRRWSRTRHPLIHVADLDYMSARFQMEKSSLPRRIFLHFEEANDLFHVLSEKKNIKSSNSVQMINHQIRLGSPAGQYPLYGRKFEFNQLSRFDLVLLTDITYI